MKYKIILSAFLAISMLLGNNTSVMACEHDSIYIDGIEICNYEFPIYSKIVGVKEAANVRSGPSGAYNVIGRAPLGMEIEIHGVEGEYVEITFGDGYGYVHHSYVEADIKGDDAYNSYAELAANETKGVDYDIHYKYANQSGPEVSIIAIHGGGIERGTGELAEYISNNGNKYNYYNFEGLKPINNGSLHITSSKFDEPEAVKMVEGSDIILSLHGYNDQNHKNTLVGGLDNTFADIIVEELTKAGFNAELADTNGRYAGIHADNIANIGTRSLGGQIEASTAQRDALLNDEKELQKYGDALNSAVEIYSDYIKNAPTVLKTGTVNSRNLDVKESPNSSSKTLGTLSQFNTVEIIGETNYYYEIIYGIETGYVSKNSIRLAYQSTVEGTIINASDGLRVYRKPGSETNNERETLISNGSKVEIIDDYDTHYKIKNSNTYGYAAKSNIRLPEAEFKQMGWADVNSSAAVRVEPTTSSRQIGSIDKYEVAYITGESGNFYEVLFENKVKGYVSKSLIKTNEPTIETGVITQDGVALYSKPSKSNNNKIGTFDLEDKIRIIGEVGDYSRVRYDKYVGYVESKYIDIIEDEDDNNEDINVAERYGVVSGVNVSGRVYERPNSSSARIALAPKDSLVEIVGETIYYYEIQLENDVTGYISKKIVEAKDPSKVGTIVNVNSAANVRTAPSNGSVMGSIPKGELVIVVGETSNHYEVIFSGRIGYVSKGFVEVESNDTIGEIVNVNTAAVVRKGPGTSHDRLGSVSLGKEVVIVGETIYYYEIEFGNGTGYVSKQQIKLK